MSQPQFLSNKLTSQIADVYNFRLWRDLTKEEQKTKQEKDYFRITQTRFNGYDLLMVRSQEFIPAERSHLTINLKTMKISSGSPIQTPLPVELQQDCLNYLEAQKKK